MKRFKGKKIRKNKVKKRMLLFIFTFFFFFSYVYMINYLKNNRLKNSILKKDVNYVNYNVQKHISNKIDEVINSPVSMLNENVKNASLKTVKATLSKTNVAKKTENEISNVNSNDNNKPVIYVYNTHQSEEYVSYNVYEAAKVLTDKLNTSENKAYLEEQSIKVFLEQNNFKYYKSYTASRKYLDEAREKNPNLTYFFDIHRDSVSKKISTMSYNNKAYAKVLFVIGLDNPNNEKNKITTKKLNDIMESKVPGISRGIIEHGGKGYNGVYNQDVSENVFLVEIGGKDNTKQEVDNTIDVLYQSIIEYIRGVL